ncbi:peptidase [Mesorhizobium sp. NBSH29]|uniref:A24 family peptidase n=1 Tax=Mesorhizobium sp. NBSH29 TaxID=2654249 RepID=UPI0018964BC4|nr:prepilin peptidase [Mesorhizobium sp. NBSH29]QPC86550.1 peptidase [Mesorhizobium sp. NBSH29]
MLTIAIFLIFPLCMAYAAATDILSMTIANLVSIVLLATFLLVAPFTGAEWSVLALHLGAGAILLIAGMALFAFGVMGGGDVKLLASTAVWIGLNLQLVEYLVNSAVLGGILTVAIIIYRKSPFAGRYANNTFLRHFGDESAGVPYGIALAIGGLIAYPDTVLGAWMIERLQF